MALKGSNKVTVTAGVRGVPQASRELSGFRAQFDAIGKSKGFRSVMQGVGVGAGISAWNLAGEAIRGATDFLMDATRAAAADEASQAKLYTAITENAKAWDGNRDAIEDVLKERMKLGFSDDEQRESLALLVARTGDVTEALNIQRIAMDLARLKGIDLAESSRAVAMGLSGQGRALKELGINVAEMTDKQQVLVAIQAKAAGQAESYAETAEGSFLALQVTVGELTESIGYLLLPALKDLANFLREEVIPNAETMADIFGKLPYLIDPVGAALRDVREAQQAQAEELARVTYEKLAEGAEAWDTYAEATAASREPSAKAAHAIGGIQDAAWDAQRALEELQKEFRDTARSARDNSLDKWYDLSTIDDKIIVAKGEVAAARRELEEAQTKEQRAAARIRIADAERELVDLVNQARDLREDYGEAGRLLGNALGIALYNRVVAWNTKTRRELAALGDTGRNSPVSGSNETPDRRHSGGPVQPNTPYIIGRPGAEELFVPDRSGVVVPMAPTPMGTAAPMAPAPVNVAVFLDSEQIAARVERRQYFAASVAPVSSR